LALSLVSLMVMGGCPEHFHRPAFLSELCQYPEKTLLLLIDQHTINNRYGLKLELSSGHCLVKLDAPKHFLKIMDLRGGVLMTSLDKGTGRY